MTTTREAPVTLDDVEQWWSDAADFVLSRPLSDLMSGGVQRELLRFKQALIAREDELNCFLESPGLVPPGEHDLAQLTVIREDQGAQAAYYQEGGIFVVHEHATWGELVESGGALPEHAIGVTWRDNGLQVCRAHLPILLRDMSGNFPDTRVAHIMYEIMLPPGSALQCPPCLTGSGNPNM